MEKTCPSYLVTSRTLDFLFTLRLCVSLRSAYFWLWRRMCQDRFLYCTTSSPDSLIISAAS